MTPSIARPGRTMAAFLMALAGPLLVAGCFGPFQQEPPGPHQHHWTVLEWRQQQRVLALDYTLTSLIEEPLGAEPGGHCPSAWIDGGIDGRHVKVEEFAVEQAATAAAFLLVDPILKGNWSTFGAEPAFWGLPKAVDAQIQDAPGPWTNIDWSGDEIRVDGKAVELPHHWQVEHEEGQWRIDARLVEGPSDVVVIENLECD